VKSHFCLTVFAVDVLERRRHYCRRWEWRGLPPTPPRQLGTVDPLPGGACVADRAFVACPALATEATIAASCCGGAMTWVKHGLALDVGSRSRQSAVPFAIDPTALVAGAFGDPDDRRGHREARCGKPMLDDVALAHRCPAFDAVVVECDDDRTALGLGLAHTAPLRLLD